MQHKTGCLVCSKDLKYFDAAKTFSCFYCGEKGESNASCIDGHYVCDSCHSSSANDIIEKYCIHTSSTNPIDQAFTLMGNPAVKMHGPEHHFLVPAVLLAAWFNLKRLPAEKKARAVREARRRAGDVKGGFCGLHGACGAAIGTGIFMSVISRSTPLSTKEWKLSNRITAESLSKISEHDGPRCCKRDSFLAIMSAVRFVQREFDAKMETGSPVICVFDSLNRECPGKACGFFRGGQKERED